MKREAKEAIKALERSGYQEARRNSKGEIIFCRGRQEVAVHPSISEGRMRAILSQVGVDLGKGKKRSATKAKERRAAERQSAAEELDRIKRERTKILEDRDARQISQAEMRAIERRIEELDREHAYWQGLMTSTPGGRQSRARHRSGQ